MGCSVALLTGRGNSSFADKNIRKVNGFPSLQYPAVASNNSNIFDWSFCSSDSDEILECAEKVGFKKIKRPPQLATAQALHIDVINHALSEIKGFGIDVDYLFVFLANNVSVTTKMIANAWEIISHSDEVTSVVPVYREYDRHPLRSMKIGPNKNIIPFIDTKLESRISSNRQDLDPSYFLCHNFWAISVKKQLNGWNGNDPWPFLGNFIVPLEIEEVHDIHNEDDIIKSEAWLINNKIDLSKTLGKAVHKTEHDDNYKANSVNLFHNYINMTEKTEKEFFALSNGKISKKIPTKEQNKIEIYIKKVVNKIINILKPFFSSRLKETIKRFFRKI